MHASGAPAARRLEAARKAVRAVGSALRAYRLYSAGHALAQEGLLAAQDALRAYVDAYGPLSCRPWGRGVVFDFSSQMQEDDTIAELSRLLGAAKTGVLRFLAGVTAEQIAVLIETLHLPKAVLDRAGGAGRVLHGRGVQAIALEDLGIRPSGGTGPLVDILRTAPGRLAAALAEASGGRAGEAAGLLRALDRVIATWPLAERDAAWTHVAEAVVATSPPLQTELCRVIAAAVPEPWASSIAARWPPVLIAGLVAAGSGPPEAGSQDLATVLRALHRRAAPDAGVPDVTSVDTPARVAARDALLAARDVALRPIAAAAFLNALAHLDTARVSDGLQLVEREVVAAVEAEDVDTVARVLVGLAVFAGRRPDARGEIARRTLHHLLSTAVRDLIARALEAPPDDRHPLRQALAAAPEEAVPLLLELLADEERMPVRRRILALLTGLARTRIPLLAEHLADPRWYVARNVVTALAGTGDPALIPYMKTALRHPDLRVRKEALAALGALRTPDAIALLHDATRHPDPSTRAAAAHWLQAAGASPPP